MPMIHGQHAEHLTGMWMEGFSLSIYQDSRHELLIFCPFMRLILPGWKA